MNRDQLYRRTVAAAAFLLLLSSCSSERAAEPSERAEVLTTFDAVSALAPQERRFRNAGLSELPGLDTSVAILTDDDGLSFRLASDSVSGVIDSATAEFLILLPKGSESDSGASELLIRANRSDGEWSTDGIYIR